MKNFKNIMRYIGKTSKFIDYPLLITYVVLCLIGLVMVYSASMVAATKGTLTGGVPVSGTYFPRIALTLKRRLTRDMLPTTEE